MTKPLSFTASNIVRATYIGDTPEKAVSFLILRSNNTGEIARFSLTITTPNAHYEGPWIKTRSIVEAAFDRQVKSAVKGSEAAA